MNLWRTNSQVTLIVANNLASLLLDRRTDKASLKKPSHLRQFCEIADTSSSKIPSAAQYLQGGLQDRSFAVRRGRPPPCPIKLWFGTISACGYISTNQLDKASEQLKKALELSRIMNWRRQYATRSRKQDRDPRNPSYKTWPDRGPDLGAGPSATGPLRNAAACALRPRKPVKKYDKKFKIN